MRGKAKTVEVVGEVLAGLRSPKLRPLPNGRGFHRHSSGHRQACWPRLWTFVFSQPLNGGLNSMISKPLMLQTCISNSWCEVRCCISQGKVGYVALTNIPLNPRGLKQRKVSFSITQKPLLGARALLLLTPTGVPP